MMKFTRLNGSLWLNSLVSNKEVNIIFKSYCVCWAKRDPDSNSGTALCREGLPVCWGEGFRGSVLHSRGRLLGPQGTVLCWIPSELLRCWRHRTVCVPCEEVVLIRVLFSHCRDLEMLNFWNMLLNYFQFPFSVPRCSLPRVWDLLRRVDLLER